MRPAVTERLPKISLVIPAFNEAERLPRFLATAKAWLTQRYGKLNEDFEIIVVDDGSTDGTDRVVVRELGEASLFRFADNRGKGAAVRVGMCVARGELRVFADADGATPIEELARLQLAIDAGADVAIASRAAAAGRRVYLDAEGKAAPDAPPAREGEIVWHVHRSRHVTGRIYSALVRFLFELDILDTQCGFKLFTAAAAEAVFTASTVDDFSFDTEILELARRRGLRIAEVAVSWRDVAGSRVNMLRDPLRMVKTLFLLRLRFGEPVFAFFAFLWLLTVRFLPLEETGHGLGARLFFLAKVTLTFAALLPVFAGLGGRLAALARAATASLGMGRTAPSRLEAAAVLLAGVTMSGIATFVAGRFAAPSATGALIVAAIGCGLYALRPAALPQLANNAIDALRTYRGARPALQSLVALVLALFLLRALPAFDFQGHGDGYLYHLSLAESWIRDGHTGFVANSIYSGYALAIEHYYLLLKLLAAGNAEQNALAQLTHVLVGFGGVLIALNALARLFVFGALRLAAAPILLAPGFFFVFTLPKNDGYLAASSLMAVAALASGEAATFVLVAACAFVIKPTAAIAFVAIAVAALVARRAQLRLFVLAAVAMVLVWLPFAAEHLRATGNPLFPLMNGIFQSPYAPLSMKTIVPEFKPFAFDLGVVARSFGRLVVEPLHLAGLVLALVAFGSVRARLWSDARFRFLAAYALLAFFFLLVGMGEFGGKVENRHFLTALGPVAVIALAAVAAFAARSRTARRLAVAGILALGLARSHVDVSSRRVAQLLTADNLTAALLARKPILSLNASLARAASARPIRMLALTDTNTPYFLANGEFWHRTQTYPVWTWRLDELTASTWLERLAEHHITHVVLEDGVADGYGPLMLPQLRLLRRAEAFALYEVETMTSVPR